MRKILLLLLVQSLMFSGLSACKLAQDTSDTAKDGAVDTVRQIDRSKALGDLTAVTGALSTYGMQHDGKFPASLDELKLNLYYPEDLDYDPKTGQVRSKSFPDL